MFFDIFHKKTSYGVSKIFIWANSDIDGACSTIILGNVFPNLEYRSVFFGDFLNQYTDWVQHNIESYDKIFVIGMSLDQSIINKIDDSKVVFVSDKEENLNFFDSQMISTNTTSCSKLLYNKLKSKYSFSSELKKLILYVDDYNSQELKFEETKYLNGIYRTTKYNRFSTFVTRFWKGYDGFTEKEINSSQKFFDSIDLEYHNIEIYEGWFRDWSVFATFSSVSVNELAQKMIDESEKDVIIVVNPDTKFVSFRKPKNSKADILFMAESLCSGGGTNLASGGTITKKFLEFTTKLEQIEK